MDPGDALMSDQKGFEQELEQMITDILSGPSTSTPTEVSPTSPPSHDKPQAVHRKRTFSSGTPPTNHSPPPSSPKRRRLGQGVSSSELHCEHMHPKRLAMLKEQAPNSRNLSEPVSNSDQPSESFTYSTSVGPARSATAANMTPLGVSSQDPNGAATWSTLQNTVRRQCDQRKADLDYGQLLKHRRNEKLDSVDRYVPIWSPASRPKQVKKQAFPFEKLPEKIRDKIISLLMVSCEPIQIDFTWLRPFVKGHARVPLVTQKLQSDDRISYLAPVTWTKLLADVKSMEGDMAKFKGALETRGAKTKGRRSPARYLTTALLRVSRSGHEAAARAFYGQNTFLFSYAPAAWMQLESFLETIGPRNVKEIKHIRIAAPMFHRGMQEDYVEGAMLDMMSPATRMAVIKPPAWDRLLSAIKHSVGQLITTATLEILAIDLEHPMASDLWSGRYVNDKRLMSVAEAEKYVERKATGIALLRQASERLAAVGTKPVLTLYHFSKASRKDVNQFRNSLAGVMVEAEKYGWRVHPRLEDGK